MYPLLLTRGHVLKSQTTQTTYKIYLIFLASLLTLEELIQGMVSVAHYQHRSRVWLFRFISPKILIGQQSLSNLEANLGFS